MSFSSKPIITFGISFLLVFYNILSFKILMGIYMTIISIYMFLNIRNDFAILPLFIITKIQGRNFKLSKDLKEIKNVLKGSDKGHIIEELFACPAWYPILSVESVNGKVWEIVKDNLMKFKKHIPSKEKIGLIAKKEGQELLKKKEIINSKLISKLTLKIFMKWLFCENNKPLYSEEDQENNENFEFNLTYENTFKSDDFDFVNQFLTEEFLERMYDNGIQWRKEIALKGKGCPIKKVDAINSIVNILKQSKFKDLFDWENPECYSFIMQPFIVSPMINISDIAVSLKNQVKDFDKYEDILGYLEHCLFVEHPFILLERYVKENNTQYFVDMRTLKTMFDEKEAAKPLNFGVGTRGCFGRFYAKEFIKNFFEDMVKEDFFRPIEGHLYSGRNNDKENFQESIYQLKLFCGILFDEIKRNYWKK